MGPTACRDNLSIAADHVYPFITTVYHLLTGTSCTTSQSNRSEKCSFSLRRFSNRGEKPVSRIVLLWTEIIDGMFLESAGAIIPVWYRVLRLLLVLLELSITWYCCSYHYFLISLEVPRDCIHSQPPLEGSSILNYNYLVHGTLFMPCLLASYIPLDCTRHNPGILPGVIDLVLLLCCSVLSFSHSSTWHISWLVLP